MREQIMIWLKQCFSLTNKAACKSKTISIHELDIGRGLGKQLDEYRELLETIEKNTGYFSTEQGQFSAMNAATLDDYLSHLYTLKYGKSPDDNVKQTYLRPKPSFIQLKK